MAEYDGRTHSCQADAVLGDIFLRHEFVEHLHHAIGEEVVGGRTEIVLVHGPVAINFLRRAIDRLAAGEDDAREFITHGGLEQVHHAEHIYFHAERWIGFDLRAHQVGEVDAVRDVAVLVEHGDHGALVGNIHRHHLRALERGHDCAIRLRLADDDRDAARQQVSHDACADEAGSTCD